MKKLRVAIIGNGGICNAVHVPQYLKMTDTIEVVALCDIILERAEALRDRAFPNADVYANYQDIIDRTDIDCVDVCTPNYLHSIIAVAALKSGKHVFTEKPDAINVEEAEKMKRAAEESGKVLMVMRNNRHVNTSQYLKKYIADGKAGDLYAGRCGWIRRRGIPGKGGWFTTKAQSGGGPLIDLGVHLIDLSIWLMGNPRPVAVSGCTYAKFADNDTKADSEHAKFGDAKSDGIFDVEDLAIGFIKFDNGASLQIEFSWASNIEEERRFVELRGTKAGFSWVNDHIKIFTEENGLPVKTERGQRVFPVSDKAADVVDLLDRRCRALSVQRITGGHGPNLAHFYDVVANGAEPDFVPQQGVNMIKILSAIYESAETGKEVRL